MNRLAEETSPYLRQHAANPVDWYPWGQEAFATARARDLPVLLSIGYSACHWCHVMAHETFEDPASARVMNTDFVNIKVDREERPDVDSIYMEAVQAVTGSGGWPMTVFLLPDGRPFLGGTYFPRQQFLALLGQISQAWRARRPDLEEAAGRLAEAVRSGTAVPGSGWTAEPAEPAQRRVGGTGLPEDLLTGVADALLARHDPEWGGFGGAPKFPQPVMLELLLLASWRADRPDITRAVTMSLDAMAAGGIYDHLGGGFARYATDRRWLVPHFEKMLYDNAQLARLYLHAWQLTGSQSYRQVVTETLEYLLRPPIRLPAGGLASAEDADSEGEEGRFYVWDQAELLEVGGPAASDWYGVTPGGNWEHHNILFRPVAGPLERPPAVEEARRALLARRDTRTRPGLDDKVLTEWNAMAVSALAEAGAALQHPGWVAAGEELGGFLLANLRRPTDGRWLRSWQATAGAEQAGAARHLAYAADYAWLVEAFTRLAEATGKASWIRAATETADAMVGLFRDDGSGAFFTTGHDAEELIARPVDSQDGAVPSANSVAAAALFRLAGLTGTARYRTQAEDIVAAMGPALVAAPMAFAGLVTAAELDRGGLTEVVVTGDRPDLVAVVHTAYLPAAVLAWGEPYGSPLWEGRQGPDQADLAFVCHHYACQAPTSDPGTLRSQLTG
jgi:uncharacterized protein